MSVKPGLSKANTTDKGDATGKGNATYKGNANGKGNLARSDRYGTVLLRLPCRILSKPSPIAYTG